MLNKVLFFLVFFCGIQALAGDDHWIQQTVDYTINTKFSDALRIVNGKIEADSNDYRAQFYLAATLNSKMTHFENHEQADQFNKAVDRTIQIIEAELDSGRDLVDSIKAELFFYQGSAYGYRAFFEGNDGNYVSAISNGMKSVSALKQAVKLDSTLYGAELGIGVYKYWLYSRLKFITWLPFIPDDREEAIAMIKRVIAHDTLSKYMAMHQLVYILLDYGRYEEAIFFADKIVKQYPDSQFMWWANAHAYYKNKDFLKAKSSYLKLYNLIMEDPNRNISHLLRCKLKLAMVYRELSDFKACKNQCDSILEMSEKFNLNDSMEEVVSLSAQLSRECTNHLNN